MRVLFQSVAYVAVAGLFACTSPTDTCGCSPLPPGEAVVYGTAVAQGSPMAGSEIIATQLDELCRSRVGVRLNRAAIVVGTSGAYEGLIESVRPKVCLQLGIVPQGAPSDTVWSAAIVAEFVINPAEAYRYRIDFVHHTGTQ